MSLWTKGMEEDILDRKSIFSFKRLHKVPETVDEHGKLKYEKWTDKISQSLSFMVRSLNYRNKMIMLVTEKGHLEKEDIKCYMRSILRKQGSSTVGK